MKALTQQLAYAEALATKAKLQAELGRIDSEISKIDRQLLDTNKSALKVGLTLLKAGFGADLKTSRDDLSKRRQAIAAAIEAADDELRAVAGHLSAEFAATKRPALAKAMDTLADRVSAALDACGAFTELHAEFDRLGYSTAGLTLGNEFTVASDEIKAQVAQWRKDAERLRDADTEFAGTTPVRILVSTASVKAGHVVEMPTRQAREAIRAGHAEPASAIQRVKRALVGAMA